LTITALYKFTYLLTETVGSAMLLIRTAPVHCSDLSHLIVHAVLTPAILVTIIVIIVIIDVL